MGMKPGQNIIITCLEGRTRWFLRWQFKLRLEHDQITGYMPIMEYCEFMVVHWVERDVGEIKEEEDVRCREVLLVVEDDVLVLAPPLANTCTHAILIHSQLVFVSCYTERERDIVPINLEPDMDIMINNNLHLSICAVTKLGPRN
ncbi:uncharacterized protein LOC109002108 isoform X2 [Juglans regia]|uniref:Uncharacterized protein LOC109002108 isoform X2 n=2 Tax=Juglans regia TaxID=51240 RepID=A0A2I4FUC9_JUGRE|nr:uncharacterized protein LOC109002108 isoform X2 [Juglans regia]